MSYGIEKGESLAAAFGRIAAEEIKLAMTELRRPNCGDAVHNARKAMKRLRALLRSLRVAFPHQYRAENRRISAAARKISPVRDIQVQLRTLDKLEVAGSPMGDRVRRQLLRRQTSLIRKIPSLRQTVRDMLDASHQKIAAWPFRKATQEDLVAGLKRIYKQGRKAFKVAQSSPSPIHLHEWRKKAKSLGYGLELIESLGPARMSKMKRCSQALSEALGDDHDLLLVWHALRIENRNGRADDFAPLIERIRQKRVKLQKEGFKLGKRLYAERPSCFERRLNRYLHRAKRKKSLR
jgi:CHAD domain-containing protein